MVPDLTPAEARDRLAADPAIRVLDGRTPEEWEAARLPGAVRLDEDLAAEIVEQWNREAPVLVLCHHGVRSKVVAYQLRGAGFTNVMNLRGGLDGWSTEVDSEIPRYKICPGGAIRPA